MRKKRTRWIGMLLIFSLIMSVLPCNSVDVSAAVYSGASDYLDIGNCGSNLTYVLNSNGVLSITGEGEMTSYSDASLVPWFQYRSLITAVNFSGNITGIGAYAFDFCVSLTGISIPDSVTSIGTYSFYGCSALTNITIPGNVTGVGAYAFSGCSALANVTISDGVASIGSYAFSDCMNLTDIQIPDSVTSIGEEAFYNTGVDDSEIAYRRGKCGENLTWALLGGNKISVYGTGAMTDYTSGSAPWYSYNKKIKDVVISNGVTHIGDNAFKGCSVLSSVSFADSVQSIGSNAFSGCSYLSEINIPEGVTDISNYAFYQSGLTNLVYTGQDKVSISIGDYAFAGCTKLEKIALSVSFESIGSHTFANCTALSMVTLPDDCSALGEYMFFGCTALNDIVIPQTVTEIRSYAFGNCTGFSQIMIPNSVTAIRAGAFSGCSGLKKIQFSSHIQTIGDYAFKDCVGFASVIVPDNVTEIGNGAFSGCSNIENITLPFVGGGKAETASAQTLFGYIFGSEKFDKATEAKQYYSDSKYASYYVPDALRNVTITGGEILCGSFDNCSGLECIAVPEGITSIGSYAFRGCTGLKDFIIPAGVTDLGDYVFGGCTGFSNIKLRDNIKNIGIAAFSDCTGLEYIGLPKNLTEIAGNLFQGCTGLKSIEIPEGVASIGDYAFSGCAALKSMVLSKNVSAIGCGAFQDCTGLQKIEVPKGVTALKDCVFQGCTALESVTIPETVTVIGNNAFQDCARIGNIMIPAVVTEIGSGAFRNCSGLKSVKVPDSVVSIGSGAFSGCSNLTEIILPFIGGNAKADKASGSTLFGYIFGTGAYPDGTATKQNYSGSGTSIYYIPDALTRVTVTGGSILYGAFSGCGKLSDIRITGAESITKIGDYAFSNCTGMKSFTIPEYVTAIGARAFGGCTGLENMTLPDSVKSIGDYAFSGCTEMRGISLSKSLETIGSYAFQNCSSLTDITVPDTVMTINAAAFSGCSSLKKITLPFVGNSAGQTSASAKSLFGYIFGAGSYAGGTAVRQYYTGSSSSTYYIPSSLKTVVLTGGTLLYGAFYNCSGLTGITLPDDITDIGNNAFYNCSGLTGINVPKKLTSIGDYAFCGCNGLTEINLPSGITGIGAYAFKDCTGLKSFAVPGKVTGISNYTFSGCTDLENISIPDSVTTIGTYAFQNCSSMAGINIPESVAVINAAAFSGCSGLESMTLPFVGYSANQTSASAKSLFGYIFGTTAYTGGIATKQSYGGSSGTYYIPSSLKTVVLTGGNLLYGAFYNCSNLTGITLPDNITDIGKYAFYNCTGITGIRIPSEVNNVSAYAFANCSGVQSITFLGSAPATIDAKAFTGDTATVYYPVSDSSWSSYVGNQYGGTLTWVQHTHSYVEAVTKPTCTEQGYTTYRCNYCDSSYVSDYVNAPGHQETITDAGVPATCTAAGLTDGSRCSVCQEIITAQVIIPATGHSFTDYVSNQDATYDADGTMTANCAYGCGEKSTITDTGSMLTDANKPAIEINVGTNRWTGFLNAITFGLFFQNTQTVTVTASDNEKLPNGSIISRLEQVYYYISDTPLKAEKLESISWKKYTGTFSLNPSKKYIVYAKAEDKSQNITYASSEGIIVDDTVPVIAGLSEGSVYCRQAGFSVTDISLKSVTDNGREMTASDGWYSIAGDDRQHNIVAVDDCGNRTSVNVTVMSDHIWGTYSYNSDATCLTAGSRTATCERGCGMTHTEIDVTHPATGHSYGEPVFVWSGDSKSCTAIYTCTNDSSHVEQVNCVVKAESIDATCTATGEMVYTATAVLDGKKATDSKKVSGAVLGHDYAAEFTWSADMSSCTVTLTCRRSGCSEDTPNHILEKRECTVETCTTAATCAREGKIEVIAGATVAGVRYTEVGSTTVLPPDDTKHGNTQIVNRKEAACLAEGYTGDTYCNDCKRMIETGNAIAPLEHANIVTVGAKDATAIEDGYTGDVYCSDCGTLLSYGSVIPKTGQSVTATPEPDKTAAPTPAATPEPHKTAAPTPAATPEPDKTAAPTPAATPEPDKTVSPTPAPTPEPDSSASPSPAATPKPDKSASLSFTVTPKPDNSASPAPAGDGAAAVPHPVGTRIKDGKGAVYTVTKSSGTDGTVSYTAPKNKNVTSVKIPDTITIDGITYQVTEVADSAFANCKKLRKVTIGKNIISIGKKAFYRDKKLKKIIFKTSKLKAKKVGAKAFSGIHTKAILKIPVKKKAAYKKFLKKRGVKNI